MELYYYSLISIFCILAFLMVADPNFSTYFYLLSKLVQTNIRGLYYLIKLHPYNFITSWQIRYRSHRMARDIMKEINKNKEG